MEVIRMATQRELQDYAEDYCQSHTPWGRADRREKIAEGIIEVSTPSHGGIWLSDDRIAQLPANVTNFVRDNYCGWDSLHWWEEDCDWVVPYIIFKDDIGKYGKAYKFIENLATAYFIAQRHHPEILTTTDES
jgi:hypothetical protein